MRKVLILIGILLIGVASAAYASQLMDPPHGSSNAIVCNDCHNLFTAGTYTDTVCSSCHNNGTGGGYTKNSAPAVSTHSSATTSTKYGTWSTTCISCHWTENSGLDHGQLQLTNYVDATYLITGTVTSVTAVTGGTRIGYSNIVTVNSNWTNPASWVAKSQNSHAGNERGLIFIKTPVSSSAAVGAEIKTVDAVAGTLTVSGNPGTVAVGNTFALIYGQFIRYTVRGAGNVNKNVAFYSNSGPNSFAYKNGTGANDTNPDGICQVCHTLTSAWRADGTLAAAGTHANLNGANCVSCHKHENGFSAPACDSCHGQPPVDAGTMVHSPAATGSTTFGKHDKHVNTLGMACTKCHAAGTDATHANSNITMSFNLFSGVTGGSYAGQALPVHYDAVAPTTVSNAGTKQCSSIYCHSAGQANGGGALQAGDYKTPSWDAAAAAMNCGSCHVDMASSASATGSHVKHAQTANIACATCHSGFTEAGATHVNHMIDLAFSGSATGTTYSKGASHTAGTGYGTCSTSYCHSSAQGPTGTSSGVTNATPTWGGAALDCGSCHVNMDSSASATGSHVQHAQGATTNYACAICHNGYTETTTGATHADGSINLAFSGAASNTIYSQGNTHAPANGYGTCSTSNCHGTTSPQWGANTGAATCEKCHGSAATAAVGTFKDTAGNASVVHVAHLAATHSLTNAIACSSCHNVPAGVNSAGHIDTPLPAEVTGALGYASGACSTAYCHGTAMPKGTADGANKTPSWSDTGYLTGVAAHDCAQCHGYPPVGIDAHIGATGSTCINCHTNVNANGNGFITPSLHINGVVEVNADDCSVCHTTANLLGSHSKHVNANTILAGKKLSNNDFGNASWWYGSTNTGGVPQLGCGNCHPNTVATHMNGTKNLNFDPNESGISVGTLKGRNGYEQVFSQNPGVSVTCSSVYCHSNGYDDGTGYGYQTTPEWYGGSFTGDKCSSCHGNSPNSGGKKGSLSHYNPNAMGLGVAGGHYVGIHYNTIFTGTAGLAVPGTGNTSSHGNAATSSTINCQTCHAETVASSANDKNTVCATCHTADPKGTMAIAVNASTHINGTVDVSFDSGYVKSMSQIRGDINAVSELGSNWARQNGYKQAGSTDASIAELNASASYNSGAKTCSSVACHNGKAVTWGAPNVTCNSCHTSLP